MSKKRVTITDNSRNQPHEAKVYPHERKSRGKTYYGWIVRGWKEDGKWQRRTFAKETDAIEFARIQNINLINHGRQINLVTSELDEEQTRSAEKAFKALGETYSLDEAIEFFLKHNRPPEFTTTILEGLKAFTDEKERNKTRPTTIKRTTGILKAFAKFTGNPKVHTVTEEQVKTYLASLRAGDKISPAKSKTFNNHRNEIASFFLWAGKKDLGTNRPWTFNNPTENVPAYSNERVREERPPIATTSPDTLRDLFTHLMGYKEGKLVKWYALAYFTGTRPSTDQGELSKLAEREDELINLTTGTITLPASITKTKHDRQIIMPENLIAWLKAYEGKPIMPANLKNDSGAIRKLFDLQQDETRHSFISYHVALHRSLGDTALQAGNSESMVRRHYLNLHSKEEGQAFFSIVPDTEKCCAVIDPKTIAKHVENFKVI